MKLNCKLITGLTLTFSFFANAIIIRHDVNDKKYIQAAQPYIHSVVSADGCMGTLIEKDWILTAAHCVIAEQNRPFWVQQLKQKRPVAKRIIHPKYREGRAGYDLALLQLTSPLENSQPIQLYNHSDELNKEVLFIGSGDFGNGLKGVIKPTNQLRAAQNTIIDVTINEVLFEFNHPEHALPLEGISGPHDSGGPALIKKDNSLYVAGVSSWQDYDVKEGLYGVIEHYSRVSTAIPWIEQTIAENQPPISIENSVIKAIKSDENAVSRLSKSDIDKILKSPDKLKQTLLAIAYSDDAEPVAQLFKRSPQLVHQSIEGIQFIQYLMEIGNWELVEIAIKSGANIHGKNSFAEPYLAHLVMAYPDAGNFAHLAKLFNAQGIDINAQDPIGNTALAFATYFATINLNHNRVQVLLALGANPNVVNKDGYSPLMDAARSCDQALMAILIKHGAKPTLEDKDGKTADFYFKQHCQGTHKPI